MSGDAPKTRWLVLSGSLLFPVRLAKVIGEATPLASSTVAVHDAFLSFDVPGVPFVEPCYANVLIKGVNDDGDWIESAEKEKGDGRDSEAYKRWVWARCSPGVDYAGNLPRELEGVAYELTDNDFRAVVARAVSLLPTVSTTLVPVQATRFQMGDPSQSDGKITGEILVAQPKRRLAGLQPTRDYLMLVLRGAFLNVLSQPFLAQLTILRPYDPSPPIKALSRRFYRLCLLPSFILFYLPGRALRAPLWAQLGAVLCGRSVHVLQALERLARGVAGSGYWNDVKV
ncbi:hypothetical protein JCM3770_001646 [Rhodotorula araucariae]